MVERKPGLTVEYGWIYDNLDVWVFSEHTGDTVYVGGADTTSDVDDMTLW